MRIITSTAAALLAAGALASPAAHAVQPLDVFLAASHQFSPDNREAAALAVQRAVAVDQVRGRLLPSLTARGSYTWNQREIVPNFGGTELVIAPEHQLDAIFQLDIPVVDVAGWQRVAAAEAAAEAADAMRAGTQVQIDKAVARAYYQLISAEAVKSVADANVKVATELLDVATKRFDQDAAPKLEVRRADANLARAQGSVADADLAVTLARRRLESLTGVAPEPVTEFPADDLHAEAAIESFLPAAAKAPAVRSASARVAAAEKEAKAQELQFIPTLSAQAAERITNATGFIDESTYATLGVALTWRFDFANYAALDLGDAQVGAATAGVDRARLQAEDEIFEAWHRVATAIAKSRAARVEAEAAEDAAKMAALRYHEGAGTQLDLVTAQRDEFAAQVSRIQADGDVAFARTYLRLATRFE
ncbi:MAG: TolC family protein [Myxococcales bacterium]|nr:TolC family protein [Myxococcales bacterium]MCB9735937.1 TolC family protein [Deltaproteobacteria bacterium]